MKIPFFQSRSIFIRDEYNTFLRFGKEENEIFCNSVLKILFKVIYSNLKKVPPGTHYILSDVFVTNEGATNGQETFSNKDYNLVQKRHPEDYKIINDIVSKAKMYKEA